MTSPLASQIVITHAGNSVELVASLRAAIQIERLHTGFSALLLKVQEMTLSTIKSVILAAGNDKVATLALLQSIENQPLSVVRDLTLGPVFALITCLMTPVSNDQGEAAKTDTKPVAWSEFLADLYELATGWLGWPPAIAWESTINEIVIAFKGMIAKLKATSGAEDDTDTTNTPDQRAQNEALGLDPDFDRAGLQALQAKYG
jgi:hypothetical protein